MVKQTPDQTDDTKLPAFTDGRKYRIRLRADDVLNPEVYGANRDFYYDVTRPTITVTIPEALDPTEPSSLDDADNVFRNQWKFLEGNTKDNVADVVIGARRVFYCV